MNTSDGFVRQRDNPGAVLNTDNEALAAYKKRKLREATRDKELNNLKEELSEIKSLMHSILEKLK